MKGLVSYRLSFRQLIRRSIDYFKRAKEERKSPVVIRLYHLLRGNMDPKKITSVFLRVKKVKGIEDKLLN